MEFGNLAAWVAAVVAIIVAVRAWFSERSARKSAAEAKIQAERSTDAAERSATEAGRAADALERQTALAEADAARRQWELHHMRGAMFRAVNATGANAFDIRIRGAGLEGINGQQDGVAVDLVLDGHSVEFMADSSDGTDVTIAWSPAPDPTSKRFERGFALPV